MPFELHDGREQWLEQPPEINDSATSFTLDLHFNVPSATYIQALEFDQSQYLYAGNGGGGGVTSNTRLYFGTECVTGSVWKVWNSYSAAWISTTAACSYTVSPSAFNHLTIAVHRVAGDNSCSGGYSCMYYDSITLNGQTVVSNVKTSAGPLPSGWAESTGFMIQLDTKTTCGASCTITEYIDEGNFWEY